MNPIDPPAIVREVADLAALAVIANAEHDQAEPHRQAYQEHARAAGAALIAAKAAVGHGAFRQWIADNLTYSRATANRYMKMVKCLTVSHLPKPSRTAEATVNGLMKSVEAGKTILPQSCGPTLRRLADLIDPPQATPDQPEPSPKAPPTTPKPAPKAGPPSGAKCESPWKCRPGLTACDPCRQAHP